MKSKILNVTRVYSGYLKVEKVNARVDDHELCVEVINRGNSAAILLVDPDTKECIVVEQFRPAIMGSMMGLPAGMIEKGQTAQDAVIRELEEETNIIVEECDLIDLGAHYLSPGILTETTHCFLALVPLDEVKTPYSINNKEESEFLTVHKRPLGDLTPGNTASASLTICKLGAEAIFMAQRYIRRIKRS